MIQVAYLTAGVRIEMLEHVQVRRETQVTIDMEPEGLGRSLQSFFDGVTGGPLPDRLTKLADELEAAFERGDIFRPA